MPNEETVMKATDIQKELYKTMTNISTELLNKTDYLYIVEGQVTEIDSLGNCYIFQYQNEDYVGFSITGEKYKVGDLIYILFSKNKNIKKMILSKTKSFSNNNIRYIAESAKDAAKSAEETAQEALDKITDIVKDNKISPSEKILVSQDWDLIKKEYILITDEMEIYGGADNVLIKPVKSEYDNNYISLKTYIEPILADMEVSTAVDGAVFLEKFNNYYISKQKVLNVISEIVKTIADEAKKLSEINKKLLDDIASDNKLTPSEKQSVLKEWETIKNEYVTIIQQSENYGITTDTYTVAYENLKTYITSLLLNLNTTDDIVGTVFREKFINYYDERQSLQKVISDKAKELADNAQTSADEALTSAKNITIKSTSQVFSKTKTQSVFSPATIQITAEAKIVAFQKFQYKVLNGSSFVDVVNNTHGMVVSGSSITLSKDSDLFTATNNGIIFKAVSNDANISDTTTIIKVSDGIDGTDGDGLSVILTNEAHVFPGGTASALSSQAYTEITAYLGANTVNVKVKSISTLPTGLTSVITNNDTKKPRITFNATTLLTKVSDSILITLEVNGQTIEKVFSYSLGLKGSDGKDGDSAYNIIVGNENESIPCTDKGLVSIAQTIEIPISAYYGIIRMPSKISLGALPIGVTSSITDGTSTTDGKVVLNVAKDSDLGKVNNGNVVITVTIDGISFNKQFSWSKSIAGSPGQSGMSARYVVVTGDQVFKKSKGSSSYLPSTITITAVFTNCTYANWQYKNNSNVWTNITTGITSTTCSVTPTSAYFVGDIAVFRALSSTGEFDTISVSRVQDGEDGADGVGIQGPPGADGKQLYTWLKYADTPTSGMSDTPENKAYMGVAYNKTTNVESSTYADYQWSLIKGKDGVGIQGPAGADGKPKYTWVKYADNSSGGGISDSPTNKKYIGLAYNKDTQVESNTPTDYEWSLIKGEDGLDAYSVILQNENHSFPGDVSTAITSSASTRVLAFKGTTQLAVTIGTPTGLPTGMTTSIANNGTINAELTFNVTPSLITPSGQINIPLTIDGKSFTKIFSYSISFKGSVGVGIKSSAVTYQVSASGTVIPTGTWVNSPPSVPQGQYLWTRTVITYTDNNVSTAYSVSRSAVDGGDGSDGKGIKTYIVEYQVSSSGTVAPTGAWSQNPPNLSANQFLWTRNTTTYTDNSTSVSYSIGKAGANGADGEAGRVYILQTSDLVIKKGADNVLNPGTVTFSAFYRDGTSATRTAYATRFIISESTDGINFTNKYTSSANETTKAYTPSSSDIKIIRCLMHASGGVTTVLDSQSITVLTDIDNIEIGGRNLALNTNQGVLNWSWGMQAGDYTKTEVVEDGIRCCKLTKGSVAHTGWNFISYYEINRDKYLPNKQYTISFDIKSSTVSNINGWLVRSDGLHWLCIAKKMGTTIPNEWVTLSCVVTTLETLPTQTGQILYLTGASTAEGTTHIFRNLTISEGNKRAPWSPAPEDIENKLDAEITTVTDKVSNVEKDLSGFKTTVGQTYTTKTEFNNLEIGGTNLLNGTKDFSEGIATATIDTIKYRGFLVATKENATTTQIDMLRYANYIDVKPSTDYVLSFYGKGKGTFISFFYASGVSTVASGVSSRGNTTTAPDGYISHTFTTDWEKYWIRWRTDSTATGLRSVLPMRLAANSTGYICGVKFEEGSRVSDWSPSAEDIANSVQIGGRNLALGTAVERVNLRNCDYEISTLGIDKDKQYTVSFYFKANKAGTYNVYLNDDTGANRTAITFGSIAATDTAYHFYSFTAKPTGTTSVVNLIRIRVYGNSATDLLGSVKQLKLEEGNKNTTWGVAPEDIEDSIDSVNNKFGSYYTKVETNSAIAQTASNITSEVSEKYTTKNDFNGLQLGSRNLLYNSSMSDNLNKWGTYNPGISIVTEDGFKCLKIDGSLNTTKYVSQAILSRLSQDLTTHYTVCAWTKVTNYVAGTASPAALAFYLEGVDTSGNWMGTTGIGGAPGFGPNNQGWKFVSYTFYFAKAMKDMSFKVFVRDVTGSFFIRDICLVQGDKAIPFVPAPEDVDLSIDQAQKDAIASANGNTANVLKGYYTSSQTDTKINQSATDITSTVAKTYTTKADFDALEIGGRNLWKNSTFDDGLTGYTQAAAGGTISIDTALFNGHKALVLSRTGATSSSGRCNVQNGAPVIGSYSTGDIFILSAWVYIETALTTNILPSDIIVRGSVGDLPRIRLETYGIPLKKWTRVTSEPFEAKADGTFTNCFILLGGDGKFKVSQIKLEKGAKATDWSPATEDIDSSISQAEKDAIASANSNTSNSLKSYYTKTETNTEIKQSADNITSTVSQTYTAKLDFNKSDKKNYYLALSATGKLLYEDVVFKDGVNSVYAYNNGTAGNVTVTRIAKTVDCPTTSTHMMQIKTTGPAGPGIGGFVQRIDSRANAIFLVKYLAAFPVGYQINTASNSMGSGYTDTWLTPVAGTGTWETYVRLIECGATGTFSNGGHIYLAGPAATAAAPVTWYLGGIYSYDITDADTVYTRVSSVETKTTPTAMVTTISTAINGGTALTTTKFTMDASGFHVKGGGIDISNNAGTKVLSADASGNLILNNIIANNGTFNGTINATTGKIGGFSIGATTISTTVTIGGASAGKETRTMTFDASNAEITLSTSGSVASDGAANNRLSPRGIVFYSTTSGDAEPITYSTTVNGEGVYYTKNSSQQAWISVSGAVGTPNLPLYAHCLSFNTNTINCNNIIPLEISTSYGNEIVFNSTSNGVYFGYRAGSRGNKVNTWIFCDGNGAGGRGAIDCRTLYASTIYTDNWFRSQGSTGWFNETYSGGWYMVDSTYIRAYNNKKIHTANTSNDAVNVTGGITCGGAVTCYAVAPQEIYSSHGNEIVFNAQESLWFGFRAGSNGRKITSWYFGDGSANYGYGTIHAYEFMDHHTGWLCTSSPNINFFRHFQDAKYLEIGTYTNGAFGIYYTVSDQKYKKDIKPTGINDALAKINKLEHVQFNWIDNNKHERLGYIANKVKEIMPELVFNVKQPDGSDQFNINQVNFLPLITLSIQELDGKVENIKEENEKLKQKLKELDAKYNFLISNKNEVAI